MKVLKPSLIAVSLLAFTAANPTDAPLITAADAGGGIEKPYRGGTKKRQKEKLVRKPSVKRYARKEYVKKQNARRVKNVTLLLQA